MENKNLKPEKTPGEHYATNNIVDLDNYKESDVPEVSWPELYSMVATAFEEGRKYENKIIKSKNNGK